MIHVCDCIVSTIIGAILFLLVEVPTMNISKHFLGSQKSNGVNFKSSVQDDFDLSVSVKKVAGFFNL